MNKYRVITDAGEHYIIQGEKFSLDGMERLHIIRNIDGNYTTVAVFADWSAFILEGDNTNR